MARYLPDPLDLFLAVALALVIAAQALGAHEPTRAVFGLLAALPLAYRRRWPLAVFGVVLVGVVGAASRQTFWPDIFAGMTATYSIGVYSGRQLLSAIILVATSTGILLTFGGNLPPLPEFSTPFLILLVPWLVGTMIRDRQLQADAYREKAVRLEEEQDRATEAAREAARAEERQRIARELHDVTAHGVSVMVVQAGAARQVLDSSPEQAIEALLSVEATGREAMAELRTMLAVLHDDGGMGLAPQPGIEQVESLVRRVGEAGLSIELRIVGQPRAVPQGVSLSAYRIIQEALTNALKYADGAQTEVVLDYREGELKIEVLDEGVGTYAVMKEAPGRGLVGMRERVALYGGRLEAGPRLERGYAVRAWLPLGKEAG